MSIPPHASGQSPRDKTSHSKDVKHVGLSTFPGLVIPSLGGEGGQQSEQDYR